MSLFSKKRAETRAAERAQAKIERQELAQRQANAIKNKLTKYENKHDVQDRAGILRSGNRLLTLLLFLMITILLLIALSLSVNVYRSLTVSHAEQTALREKVSLVANTVRLFDTENSVSTREGLEGPALVLAEDVDSQKFEMRYYLYEGSVMQEYLLASAPYSPDSAAAVFSSSQFDVAVSGNLVTITTDAGVSRVSLRSAQGGDE